MWLDKRQTVSSEIQLKNKKKHKKNKNKNEMRQHVKSAQSSSKRNHSQCGEFLCTCCVNLKWATAMIFELNDAIARQMIILVAHLPPHRKFHFKSFVVIFEQNANEPNHIIRWKKQRISHLMLYFDYLNSYGWIRSPFNPQQYRLIAIQWAIKSINKCLKRENNWNQANQTTSEEKS